MNTAVARKPPFYCNEKEPHDKMEVILIMFIVFGICNVSVLFVASFLGIHSLLPMSTLDAKTNLPVAYEGNIMLLIILLGVGFTFGNVAMYCIGKWKGSKFGLVDSYTYDLGQRMFFEVTIWACAKAAIVVQVPLMLLAFSKFSISYYNLELLFAIMYIILCHVFMAKPLNLWYAHNGVAPLVSLASLSLSLSTN